MMRDWNASYWLASTSRCRPAQTSCLNSGDVLNALCQPGQASGIADTCFVGTWRAMEAAPGVLSRCWGALDGEPMPHK
jgi:hypothetical protein